MFKPYLTKQHNINDVTRAFPEPHFFNGGSAFTWATYKLSDGTILRVGEHGEASAILKNAEGAVIQRFPFGSWVETRFPVIGSAGSPVDISPARLRKAETPPAITAASLFENWDGTLITREGRVRTDLRPKAGVLLHRYLYMTVGGHFRPTGTFVCYVPDKGVFLLLGDCVMNHAELLVGPYAGDPREVLLDVMRDSKQDAPADADKAAAKGIRGFKKIDAFVRGDARIAPGLTRAEIRKQLSKGKVKSHKPYAFRKPQPEMFKRDVWVIFYGPEVPGMGRVDVLRVSFKEGKVSKLEHKVYLCP
jgi:hypothetical protein